MACERHVHILRFVNIKVAKYNVKFNTRFCTILPVTFIVLFPSGPLFDITFNISERPCDGISDVKCTDSYSDFSEG